MGLYYNHKRYSAAILRNTIDSSTNRSLSRPFTDLEITAVKKRISKRSLHSAKGIDTLPYKTILEIPNGTLTTLFNRCISMLNAPQIWLTSILIGILKPIKPPTKLEGYRIITLKMMLLIDRRFREWMTDTNPLPESQNGFREGYRTNNNTFILRYSLTHHFSLNMTLKFAQMCN